MRIGMRACRSRPSPTQKQWMDCRMDSSFGHLEVVGTRFGIILHLDRQRSRLGALVFFVDVDRRNLFFFGTLRQDPESYLIPAERNPRSGVVAGDPTGFESIAALF